MRRIHRHWCQQQIEFTFAVIFDERTGSVIQFMQREHPDAFFRKLRSQLIIPALVLLRDKLVHFL